MKAIYEGNEVEIVAVERVLSEEEERNRQRIERMVNFFARVNSAFTFRKVLVSVEDSPIGAPAWSTSNQVTFNSRLLGDLTAKDLTKLRGLDLHECAHILFTPRTSSEVGQFIDDNKHLQPTFNLLEDMRIETLMVTSYPSVANWLTATILHFFKEDSEAFVDSYPLLRGRRYLPYELRKKSRELFPQQEIIDELCEIIDEYRLLLFPKDSAKGMELIQRLYDLLAQSKSGCGLGIGEGDDMGEGGTIVLKPSQGNTDPKQGGYKVTIKDPFGHGSRPFEGQESSTSRPMNPKKQERIQKSAKAKPFKDESTNSSTDSENKSELDKGGKSAGNESADKIETFIDDLLSEIENDIQAEVTDMSRIVSGLPALASNRSVEPPMARYNTLFPDSATMHASQKFGKELEKLKAQYDPNWERYESRGRLNVQRLVRGDDTETIFDQWNEGIENATEIECVIALDISGSMQGVKATNAYRAMYAIKRGLSKINANCSVITFSDSAEMLYRATDKVTSGLRDSGTGGGTSPEYAITYATKLLAESEKAVKIFFVITDGEWYGDNKQNHETITRMNRSGVLTAFAYIPEQGEEVKPLTPESTHYCEVGAVIRNPFDLLSMARVITKYAINRRLVNR